jgi:putative phage-type endonuclease
MGELIDTMFDRCYVMTKRMPQGRSKTFVASHLENLMKGLYPCITSEYIISRIGFKREQKEIFKSLKNVPMITQRTPEWYKTRENLITASDFKHAIGGLDREMTASGSRQLYKKKCGYEEDTFNYGACPPLVHGVKYEPAACKIYEDLTMLKVHEFGLIPHPKISFIGASPDGITEDGIMLEIKSPYSRNIRRCQGIPEDYYLQIQGQLEVCDLEECDYLECEFIAYEDFDAYKRDVDESGCRTASLKNKGCIITYHEDEVAKYSYSEINLPLEELDEWIKDKRKEYKTSLYQIDYWWCEQYNVRRVYRNRKEFAEVMLPRLTEVWNNILQFRKNKNDYVAAMSGGSSRRNNSNYNQQNNKVTIIRNDEDLI